MAWFRENGSSVWGEVIEVFDSMVVVASLSASRGSVFTGRQLLFLKAGELVDEFSTISIGRHTAGVAAILSGRSDREFPMPSDAEKQIRDLCGGYSPAVFSAISSNPLKSSAVAMTRELRFYASRMRADYLTQKDQRRLCQFQAHIDWLSAELANQTSKISHPA